MVASGALDLLGLLLELRAPQARYVWDDVPRVVLSDELHLIVISGGGIRGQLARSFIPIRVGLLWAGILMAAASFVISGGFLVHGKLP